MKKIFGFLIFALMISSLNLARAQSSGASLSVVLPNKAGTIQTPPLDLVDPTTGEVLGPDLASQLAKQGRDLSLLDPTPNILWRNAKQAASNEASAGYPESEIQYLDSDNVDPFSLTSKVKNLENGKFFRLRVSLFAQTIMMRSAMLRKLGYATESPKLYRNLKVNFSSSEDMDEFLSDLEESIDDYNERKWISDLNASKKYIVLSSAILEVETASTFDFYSGKIFAPGSSALNRYSGTRAYRGMFVPLSLVEVGRSVNNYSPTYGATEGAILTIPYFNADSFGAANYDDLKWIIRKLALLSDQDLKEVVDLAQYPSGISEVVYAKLRLRVRSAAAFFGLKALATQPELSMINSGNGLVVSGKVMRAKVPGWPQEFAGDQVQSPFEDGDLGRFLDINLTSSAIATLLAEVGKKMQLFTIDDALTNLQRQRVSNFFNFVKNNPGKPFNQPITSWGGPLAGLDASASRTITTGTFNGSDAPVQLVDNFSVSGALGYFRALDGIKSTLPMVGANVSKTRDYTHVRPISSVKEGADYSREKIFLPAFMKNLSGILKAETSKEVVDEIESDIPSIQKFLSDLKDGEVFTITDSVAKTAYIRSITGLDALLGVSPLSFLNSVSINVDTNRVVTRQVMFLRVVRSDFDGIHVYVRDMRNKGQNLQLDVNFYINLLKINARSSKANIATDAFLIDYKNTVAGMENAGGQEDKLTELQQNLRLAVRDIFRKNSVRKLFRDFNYQQFKLKHDLDTKTKSVNFLWWNWSSFNENHLVKMQFPPNKDFPDLNPKDAEVTLFASQAGRLKGKDIFGFGQNVVNSFLDDQEIPIQINTGNSDNPANNPMGKARWTVIRSETDLTSGVIPQKPSVSMIQRVWGGWRMSKKDLQKLISEIKAETDGTGVASYSIMSAEDFNNLTSLDFYRINMGLTIFEAGLKELEKTFTQNQVRPLIESLIRMSAKNGNIRQAALDYAKECKEDHTSNEGVLGTYRPVTKFEGETYPCISKWALKILKLGRSFPNNDKRAQAIWRTQLLQALDEKLPISSVMNLLGTENYIFLVQMAGLRSGDENLEPLYFSSTLGRPQKDLDLVNGLYNYYSNRSGIIAVELMRTQGSFQ